MLLTVHDLSGRVVTTLRDGPATPGRRTATWDCTDSRGLRAAVGVYFVRLVCGNEARVGKVVVPR